MEKEKVIRDINCLKALKKLAHKHLKNFFVCIRIMIFKEDRNEC